MLHRPIGFCFADLCVGAEMHHRGAVQQGAFKSSCTSGYWRPKTAIGRQFLVGANQLGVQVEETPAQRFVALCHVTDYLLIFRPFFWCACCFLPPAQYSRICSSCIPSL